MIGRRHAPGPALATLGADGDRRVDVGLARLRAERQQVDLGGCEGVVDRPVQAEAQARDLEPRAPAVERLLERRLARSRDPRAAR
jgi:hypothetical protein